MMKTYKAKGDGLPSVFGTSPIYKQDGGAISLIDHACRHLLLDEHEGSYDDIRECHVLSIEYTPDGLVSEYSVYRGFVPINKDGRNLDKCTRTVASWGDVISKEDAELFLRNRGIKIDGYYR